VFYLGRLTIGERPAVPEGQNADYIASSGEFKSPAQQPKAVSWVESNTRRTSICNVCANCDCFAEWNVSL